MIERRPHPKNRLRNPAMSQAVAEAPKKRGKVRTSLVLSLLAITLVYVAGETGQYLFLLGTLLLAVLAIIFAKLGRPSGCALPYALANRAGAVGAVTLSVLAILGAVLLPFG